MPRPAAALAPLAPALLALGLGALVLAGCGPQLPKGVDPDKLDEAVSELQRELQDQVVRMAVLFLLAGGEQPE